MAPSGRSRSDDAPIPPREDTPEVDIPTQEHPLRFHHEDLFVQAPREDLRRLLDLMLDLNQVELRQEVILTGSEKRIPSLPSQPAPAQAAPLLTTQEPRPRWSSTHQCYTRRSPSGRGRADQPSFRGRRLQRSRSPSRRSRTPPTRLDGVQISGGMHSQGSSPGFSDSHGRPRNGETEPRRPIRGSPLGVSPDRRMYQDPEYRDISPHNSRKHYDESPFTRKVDECKIPKSLEKLPDLKRYDGSRDPNQHLS